MANNSDTKSKPIIDLALLDAYQKSGGNIHDLSNKNVASLTVSFNKVLRVSELPGIHMFAEELPNGIKAKIVVDPDTVYEEPIHLCFGMLPKEGTQEILSEFLIGKNANISVIAHCTFPNSIKVIHQMEATVTVEENANFEYKEEHYHGSNAGAVVKPKTFAHVKKNGRYVNTFRLVGGRVGNLDLEYVANLDENAVVELETKVAGRDDDKIRVNEIFNLNGDGARGLAKSRIFIKDNSISEFLAEANGNAPNTRGHVDCTEIIAGNAKASAIPKVSVLHESAKVTHEASIGKIDSEKLETLMARGLTEDEAIEVIIKGLLK
ncbi:MAG: SufD family Fe-S cluster assembly protein [Candidatus Thorarchaeota archaeon]